MFEFETCYRNLTCDLLEDVFLIPNTYLIGGETQCGVYLPSGEAVLSSIVIRQPHSSQQVTYSTQIDSIELPVDAVEIDELLYLGAIPDHYGHFITEGMSRLWVTFNADFLHMKKVYNCSERFKFHTELQDLVGSEISRVLRPMRVKKLWLPEASIRLQNYVNNQYWNTINRVIERGCRNINKNKPSAASNGLFLSKVNVKNGRNIGERFLENYFKSKGVAVIIPEQYGFYEFVGLLHSAPAVFASSGTQAHNAIFCNDDCNIFVLDRSQHVHPFQEYIKAKKRQPHQNLRCYLASESGDFSAGPFSLYPLDDVRKVFFDNPVGIKLALYRFHYKLLRRYHYVKQILRKYFRA